MRVSIFSPYRSDVRQRRARADPIAISAIPRPGVGGAEWETQPGGAAGIPHQHPHSHFQAHANATDRPVLSRSEAPVKRPCPSSACRVRVQVLCVCLGRVLPWPGLGGRAAACSFGPVDFWLIVAAAVSRCCNSGSKAVGIHAGTGPLGYVGRILSFTGNHWRQTWG